MGSTPTISLFLLNTDIDAQVANGISWLDDIQAFYRERAAIEKEYATKINALSRKYYDKKSKKSAFLSVGDTPQLTPGSLERYVRYYLAGGAEAYAGGLLARV
jgi:hypothetical protein